jgi:hypothetical protein
VGEVYGRPVPGSVDMPLEPGAASDRAEVHAPELLAARGWDRALLTVDGAAPAEGCVVLLAHTAGAGAAEGWSRHRLRFAVSGDLAGRTEGAAAVAVRAGTAYVVGSHRPLRPGSHWIARFDLAALAAALDGATPALELARTQLRLHRAVNDALRAAGVDVLQLADPVRQALIGAAIARGEADRAPWRRYLRYADSPLDVAGAAFAPDGALLLGLRLPATAAGHPLVVGLPDVDALLGDDDAVPACGAVWALAVGTPDLPRGIGAMDPHGDGLDVVTGPLAAPGEGGVLAEHHPEAAAAPAERWRTGPLPEDGGALPASRADRAPAT